MKSMGAYYWYAKIPPCGYMEHGYIFFNIQRNIFWYCVLCSKIYNTWSGLLQLPAGSWQVAKAAWICEMSLFPHNPSSSSFLVSKNKFKNAEKVLVTSINCQSKRAYARIKYIIGCAMNYHVRWPIIQFVGHPPCYLNVMRYFCSIFNIWNLSQ